MILLAETLLLNPCNRHWRARADMSSKMFEDAVDLISDLRGPLFLLGPGFSHWVR